MIIAAFRVKAWKPLAQFFRLLTVEQCAVEAATGDKRRKGYVPVDAEKLKAAEIVKPDTKTVAALTLSLPRGLFLDAGERDLIASAVVQDGPWFLCSPDKAAVRAMHALGRLAQVVSLEALTCVAKIGVQLEAPFTEKWLSSVRTQLELEML